MQLTLILYCAHLKARLFDINIKPPFEERRLFGPKKVRDMILTTPEEGVRKLVLEDDGYEAIRSRLFERTETKLCPAAFFKTRVPKGKVSEYLERMRRLYPELYGAPVYVS